eukprot:8777852-Lingulodinium_polyedra.AAC.1
MISNCNFEAHATSVVSRAFPKLCRSMRAAFKRAPKQHASNIRAASSGNTEAALAVPKEDLNT